MTDPEKIHFVKTMCGEEDEATISVYLEMAKQKINALAYPYDAEGKEVPAKYEHIQIEAAVYMLNKRGGEGESAHSENGISRTYESADLPASMLRGIVPYAGVVR